MNVSFTVQLHIEFSCAILYNDQKAFSKRKKKRLKIPTRFQDVSF